MLMKTQSFVVLIGFLVTAANAGRIINQARSGIVGFRTNLGQPTSLQFSLLIPTTINNPATLNIQYPNDYTQIAMSSDQYSTTDCPVVLTSSSAALCPHFTVDAAATTLRITLPTGVLAGEYDVVVIHNTNPAVATATNRVFSVQTVSEGIVVDENEAFGEYALASTFIYQQTSPVASSALSIGQTSTITFQFSSSLNAFQWLRLRIPNQVESFPSIPVGCSITLLNGTIQPLNPEVSSIDQRWVLLDSLFLRATYQYSLSVTLKLPQFQITTDNFLLELLVNNTNTVAQAYSFSGVSITPGSITSINFNSSSPNVNSLTNVTVNFLLVNPISNGQIVLTFSSGFVLAKNCTSNYNSSHWPCYSQAQSIIVPQITLYSGQNFSIQFLAINPNDAALASTLTIQTYTTFNGTLHLVDQAQLAVVLSNVQTPYYEAFDMYRPVVNATLNQLTAIDFRYVPQQGNELPLSKVGGPDLSSVLLQLPLWWRASTQSWNDLQNRFYSYYPNCTFGVEGAYSCSYARQLYSIGTPIQQIDSKYPSGKGLGQCDKPISLKNVWMPPIPGRYDFRVLTFQNKSVSSTPTEQDMFTMDIPVDVFPFLTIESSSQEAADERNLLKVSFQAGLSVPDEGTINLNFSVTETASDSAWENRLGSASVFNAGISYRQIPCGLYIRGSLQSNPQCHIYDLSASGFNVLQLSNFGGLSAGDSAVIYLPNIKFCLTATKKCSLDFSTAYTISLRNPYYLNRQNVVLTQNTRPSSSYTNLTSAEDSTLAFTVSSSPTLCTSSTWSFKLSPSAPPQLGDFLMVSVSSAFIYLNTGSIWSSNGTVGIIIDNENQQLIVAVKLNATVSGTQTILLNGMVHPYEEGTALSPTLNFWSGKQKSGFYRMPMQSFSGDGILWTWLSLLPDVTNNLAKTTTDTDLGSEAIFKFGFTLCKPVAAGGAIVIDVKDGIAYHTPCAVFSFGSQISFTGLDSPIQCSFVDGSYIITGFATTAPLLTVSTVIRLTVNTSFDLNDIKLYSYNISSPIGGLVGSNLAALGSNSYPFGQTGYTYPSLLTFDPFIQKRVSARMNQRGEFYFTVTPLFSHSFPEAVTFSFGTIIQTTTDGRLHCRIAGVLADSCSLSNFNVTLVLPIGFTMSPSISYIVSISTRGRDNSMTDYEGLTLQTSGIYTMLIEAGNAANGNYEYTYIAVEVLPSTFWSFSVYSMSKNANTRQHVQSGQTIIVVNFGCTIASGSKLIVSLYRQYAGTDGFEADLGTGIDNGAPFPCYLNFGDSSTVCTLYYGLYPNPTQVEIANFDALNGYYQIRLPSIFNPNVSLSIVQVGLTATITSSAGVTTKLYSSTYDLVNVTFGLPSPNITDTVYLNLTQTPTFSCSNVSTYCILTVPIKTGPLPNSYLDNIVLEFPADYPLLDGYVYSNWPFCYNCSLCYSRKSIVSMNTWWGLPANTLTSGWLNISTPLYRSLSGSSPITIKTLLYKDFKLMQVSWMNITQSFTEAKLTPTITCDNSNINQFTSYRITVNMSVASRSSAVFLINVPSQLNASAGICQVQSTTGVLLTDGSFRCSLWGGSTSQLLAEHFGALAKNQTIVIVVKALNPSTVVAVGSWSLQLFHLKEQPLDKLVAQGTGTSPALTSTAVTRQYWDEQFKPASLVLSGQRGTLIVKIKEAVGSGIKSLTFPTGWVTVMPGRQLFCLVTTNFYQEQSYETSAASKTVPLQCSLSGNVITVPQITPFLVANNALTKLVVTTLNDNNGITFAVAGAIDLVVETYGGSINTHRVNVPSRTFAAFSTSSLITNPKSKTLLTVKFTPSTYASSVALLLPLVHFNNKSKPLYSGDLGTGLANGSQAGCFGRMGYSNNSLPCSIVIGHIDALGYTSIQIPQPVSANTQYQFELDSLVTPYIDGDDETHVVHVLESYDASGNVVERSSYLDYTVRNIAYSNEAISYVPIRSTNNINDVGVSFSLQLKNYVASSSGDYIVIEFPQQFYNPIPQIIDYRNSTPTWVSSGNNWVMHAPAVGLAANTTFTVKLFDCANSYLVSSMIVLKAYYISNRVILRSYTFMPMPPLLVPSGTTYVPPTTPPITTACTITSVSTVGVNAGKGIQLLQSTLSLDSGINNAFVLTLSTSAAEFALVKAYTSPNSSQVFSGGSVTFTFQKTLSVSSIVVYIYGQQLASSVANTFTLTNELGAVLGSHTDSYSSDGSLTLDMSVQVVGRRYRAMRTEGAQLRLTVDLLSPMVRGEYMEINVGAWAYFTPSGSSWLAYFNNMAAETTSYSGGLIRVYSPIMGIGSGVKVTLSITNAQMTMGSSTSNASLVHRLSTGTAKQTYTKYLVPLNANFATGTSYLSFISSAQQQYSILKVSLTLSGTLTSSDTVKVIFTTHSNVLSHMQFQPTLGGYANLQTIDCISEVLLNCNVELGADYAQAPSMISLTPLQNTATLTLSVPRLMIPSSSNSTFLAVSFLLINNGVNVSELVPEYVMYPQPKPTVLSLPTDPPTTITPAPNLVGSPLSYAILLSNPLKAFSYDRLVLQYPPQLIMEQPFNFNNPSLVTSLINGNVIMYPIVRWLELSVNYNVAAGQTLTISNLKNVGWREALAPRIIEMSSAQYRSYYALSGTPSANVPSSFYSASPSPVLITQSETLTVVIRPVNRIYKGGEMQISLPNVGMTGGEYCSVVSGLTSARCEIDWTACLIRIYGFAQYEPIIVNAFNYAANSPNPIKVQLQASMPATPTSNLLFGITIFNDSQLASVNEQQSGINSMIRVQSANILGVVLNSLNIAPQLIRGNSYGTIALNFQLANTLSFLTTDYLTIDFGDSVVSRWWDSVNLVYQPQYNYLMCHFSIDHTLVQKVKTHRCEFTQWTILHVYVPEEFDLQAGRQYKLTIESVLMNSSDIYWLKFGYVHNGVPGNERGWMQWTINPAAFQTRTATVLTDEASSSSLGTDNIMNLTLQTPLSLPASTGSSPSRIVLSFPTYNEQNLSFPMSIGSGQTNASQQIGCNGVYVGNVRPMTTVASAGLHCHAIQSVGNTANNTPAYVTVNGYAAIPAATVFNLHVGRFLNPLTSGTFADFVLRIEKRTNIGEWVILNDNVVFNIISSVKAVPTPSTANPGFSQSLNGWVGNNFGWYGVNLSPSFALYPGDVVTLRYSYPYQVPIGTSCTQTDSAGSKIFQGCSTIPLDNIFLLPNNYDLPVGTAWRTIDYYSFSNPQFSYNESGSAAALTISVYSQQKLRTVYTTYMTSVKKYSYVVLQPTTDDNEELLPQLYHVGVSVESTSSLISYIEVFAPSNFSAIQSCEINRGLRRISPANPIVCSYASVAGGWLIRLSNFEPYSGDGLIILDMVLVNPAPGWTSQWSVTSFLQEGNYQNKITQSPTNAGGGAVWVGKAPARPLHFYVYRNVQSFEDRRATLNQYAQLWTRVVPRSSHSNQSTYLVSMPTSYDLPNSQQTDCNVSYSTNAIVASNACTINANRSVTMTASTLGIVQQCQILSATSFNAVDGKDGFLLPPNITGTEKFSVSIYDVGSAESTLQTVSPRPYPLLPISVDATVRQASFPTSILRMKFQTNTPVAAGYYADLPIGYQGRIEILFETMYVDSSFTQTVGFPTNLGYAQNGLRVPCKAFSGLTGSIVCTVQLALRSSIFDFAKVIVSNFSALSNNTPIELHLLNIKYAQSYPNGRASVGVRFYQIDERNNRVELSQPTFFSNPLTITYSNNPFSANYIPSYVQSQTSVFAPHFVGALSTMTLSYILSVGLSTGSMIQLTFSKEFNVSESGAITAESASQPLGVVVYEQINSVLLTVQGAADNSLTVRMLVDAAFVFTYSVVIKMTVIVANSVVHNIDVQVSPPAAAPFSVALMKLSDYTAQSVAVNYTFTIVPSYLVPIGSILTISFPNLASGLNYSNLSKSNPKEVCTSSIGVCVIAPNILTVSVASMRLDPGVAYTIMLTGVKNPPYSGITPNNSYRISITTPSSSVQYLELESYIQSFKLYPKSPPSRLYLAATGSSYFKLVKSNYMLAIQTSTSTPQTASLVLELPTDWCSQPVISSITGNWNLGSLLYSLAQTANATYTKMVLTLHFDIPGKSVLTINFSPIVNPSVATTSKFGAYTVYDSTVLDQAVDPIAIELVPTPPSLLVSGFSCQPTNEFAVNRINVTLTVGAAPIPVGSYIVFYFSNGYVNGLLGQLPLTAYVNGEQVEASIDSQKLQLTILRLLTSGQQATIVLYGILNPPAGAYTIDIALMDAFGNVYEYANQQLQLSTSTRPPNLYLSYLDLSNYGCASASQMKVCFDAASHLTSGSLAGELWVHLPQEFEQTSASGCSISINGSSAMATACSIERQRKLIAVSLPTTVVGSTSLPVCAMIDGIKNPSQPGECHSYLIGLYNPATNMLAYMSYPDLNSFNTMVFVKDKLTILVANIGDFSPMTCSLPVEITLERSSASAISLSPTIDKFTVVPNPIVFATGQSTATFILLPQRDSPYGISEIHWAKLEANQSTRYGEVAPSSFKLVMNPPAQYTVQVSTLRSQTPILQQSSNITVSLPISPAQQLRILLTYGKSPECISFSVNPLVFEPGQSTTATFTYTSKQCAISDFIYLTVADPYQSIFTLSSSEITVQLTQPDTQPPTVINHYIFDLDRNYLIYRVMTSEPVTVYSMLTLRGTSPPTTAELVNQSLRSATSRKSVVTELYLSNSSITTIYSSYVSYDTYLNLQKLAPNTHYLLYFTAVDLSGNPSVVMASPAQTDPEYFSAMITLCLQQPTPSETIRSVIVESSSWKGANINIYNDAGPNSSYLLQLVPYANSNRPINAAQGMDGDILFVQQELPLCSGFTFTANSYENVSYANGWVSYGVAWSSDAEIQVWAIAQQAGWIYASVGGSYPEQVKNGLTSDNFALYETWFGRVYAQAGQNITLKASQLFDQTDYLVYIAAENPAIPPILMPDESVAQIKAHTAVTVYSLPADYVCDDLLVLRVVLLAAVIAVVG